MQETLKDKFSSNDKKQILPELYMLRAYLSLIVVIGEEANASEQKIKHEIDEFYKSERDRTTQALLKFFGWDKNTNIYWS